SGWNARLFVVRVRRARHRVRNFEPGSTPSAEKRRAHAIGGFASSRLPLVIGVMPPSAPMASQWHVSRNVKARAQPLMCRMPGTSECLGGKRRNLENRVSTYQSKTFDGEVDIPPGPAVEAAPGVRYGHLRKRNFGRLLVVAMAGGIALGLGVYLLLLALRWAGGEGYLDMFGMGEAAHWR